MSAGAITMMIIAILIVWGGLIAAILKLRGHPEPPEDDEAPGPVAG
ncbi:methionine/alanine import family NSS transporter small subunit [Streptomyces sp. JJ36]|nr:methionine/alanine import family NSS transporter small subunit [Streptomyces sp. JJ36]MCF6525815.1 methionine/alanine import family NSS transporter small subunit [Streptomyces sp. JJ36]